MKKLFVGNLPAEATEQSVTALFSEFGTVRSAEIAVDLFTRKCRGFGFVELEGHEARAAIAGLNGKPFGDRLLSVRFADPRKANRRGHGRR